jgi:hypothetical protein
MRMTEQESRLRTLRQEAIFVRAANARLRTDAERAAGAKNAGDVQARILACATGVPAMPGDTVDYRPVVEMDYDYDGENKSYRWHALGVDLAYAGVGVMACLALLGMFLWGHVINRVISFFAIITSYL